MHVVLTLLAAAAAVIGAVGSAFTIWSLWPGRERRISYRVHLDDPVPPDMNPKLKGIGQLVVERNGQVVEGASLVLIRFRNEGATIKPENFYKPICLDFGEREVIGFHISEPTDGLESAADITRSDDGHTLTLPKILLNRGDRFKLRILLSGSGNQIQAKAHIENGRLAPELALLGGRRAATRQLVLWGGVLTASLVAVIAILAVAPRSAHPTVTGLVCTPGELDVFGSTAFAASMSKVAGVYQNSCPNATIRVNPAGFPTGSGEALSTLNLEDPKVAATMMTMSDGLPPGRYDNLHPNEPAAVVIFSVVVNSKANIHSLTRDQLLGIFDGTFTNWSQVGGSTLPIRIIGRDDRSGTRDTFYNTVIRAAPDRLLPRSSNDCYTRIDGDTRPTSPVLCAFTSTEEVLHEVNVVDGAIGYGEVAPTSAKTATNANIVQIQLNAVDATVDQVRNGSYPFWTLEYLQTFGSPVDGTLRANFRNFLIHSETAKQILKNDGHYPCFDQHQDRISLCSSP